MPMKTTPSGWLLVTVTTATGTPGLRVTVWRKLKALGALYLQQSVCLLPDRPEVRHEVSALAAKVRRDGGQARVLPIAITDAEQADELTAQMRTARDQEYGEVLERLPSFFDELDAETARGRITYEEVEESEADLARFQAWVAKIAARDYFDAAAGPRVRSELGRAEVALGRFAAASLEAEQPEQGGSDERVSNRPGGLRSIPK